MVVVFGQDGTLIDSQNDSLSAVQHGFRSANLERPDASEIINLVGLPLVETMRRLAPENFAQN